MQLYGIDKPFERLDGALPAWRARVEPHEWLAAATCIRQGEGRLVSIWGVDCRQTRGGFEMYVAYYTDEGIACLILPVSETELSYPDLANVFPAAGRMQRAVRDLLGIAAEGASDARPWLRHDAWPKDCYPLRHDCDGRLDLGAQAHEDYAFVPVTGDGVHEIPVGPIHAGIIEPGHFRFSVAGEKVLRLEERLGYTHKGVEKLLARTAPQDGYRIAGRISGDSTVAYAWAYCMALESASGMEPSDDALLLRALMLERERIANHLGDLGALGNDAGFAFGLAQFSRLKEDWLRVNKTVFGHRFMMDCVVPGGVSVKTDTRFADMLIQNADHLIREITELNQIYDEHAGLQDRFIGAGRITPAEAKQLGLCGLAGRASGRAIDLRADPHWLPYADLNFRIATLQNGDVAARVNIRFLEIYESLRLIRQICARLNKTTDKVPPSRGEKHGTFGLGRVEGWRGEVFVALEVDGNCILRCHCHDPSWHNWPVLEHAIMGNIVPDFPLINKSFNLSYSGHDL